MPRERSEVAAPQLHLRVRHLDGSSRSGRAPRFRSRRQRHALRGTGVTRRLLMEETRVLSWAGCHRSVTSAPRDMPPLRARRLNLEGRSKGAWCAVGSSERRVSGTRSNRIGPRITEPSLRKGTGRGRLDRHAHGARGDHSPKPAVTELARPALAARNPEERVHRAKASRQRVQELLNRRVAPPADGRGGSVAALALSTQGERSHASMWDRNRQG